MESFTATSSQAEPLSRRSVRRQDSLATKIGVPLSSGPQPRGRPRRHNTMLGRCSRIGPALPHQPQACHHSRDVAAMAYDTTHTNICKILSLLPDGRKPRLFAATRQVFAITGVKAFRTGAEAFGMEARRHLSRSCRGLSPARLEWNVRSVSASCMPILISRESLHTFIRIAVQPCMHAIWPKLKTPASAARNQYARPASGRLHMVRTALLPAKTRARGVDLGELYTPSVCLHQVRRVCIPRSARRMSRTSRRLPATGQAS